MDETEGEGTGKAEWRVLIEIEGPRGVGKSTLIAALCAGTGRPGQHFVGAATAEEERADPGWFLGTLMRGHDEPMPARESLFLYCARTAARARVISSLRAPGVGVLSDRLGLSLYVQARLAGIASADAWPLVRMALHEVTPDYTVLLDADYATHLQRLKEQGREPQAEPDFEAHRDYFAQAYESVPTAKVRVDTTGMTVQEVRAVILRELPLHR